MSLWPASGGSVVLGADGSAHVTLVWEFDWLLCLCNDHAGPEASPVCCYQCSQSPVGLREWADLFSEQECVCGEGNGGHADELFADASRCPSLAVCRMQMCVWNNNVIWQAPAIWTLISKCQAASVCGRLESRLFSAWWSLAVHKTHGSDHITDRHRSGHFWISKRKNSLLFICYWKLTLSTSIPQQKLLA